MNIVDDVSADVRRMVAGKASVVVVGEKLLQLSTDDLDVVSILTRQPVSRLRNVMDYASKQGKLALTPKK